MGRPVCKRKRWVGAVLSVVTKLYPALNQDRQVGKRFILAGGVRCASSCYAQLNVIFTQVKRPSEGAAQHFTPRPINKDQQGTPADPVPFLVAGSATTDENSVVRK